MRREFTVLAVFLLGAALPAAQKKVIQPREFPSGRPFSTALLVDGTLYVSGQVGADLKSGKIPDDFEAEVRQCLDNIGLVLKEAGMGFSDVVSVQVYLTDMDLFPRMNAVYTKIFQEPRPTRTTVGVTRLAGSAHLEVTVTARR